MFGGDGASFALPASQSDLAREALAAVAAWVRDAFDFELRVALVPVSEIRAQGHDVRIARFAASPDVSYAMFSGGGLAYAERRMKEGAFAIPPAPPGTLPDLTGLTCRFDEITPQRGVILSLIILPGAEARRGGLQRPRRPGAGPGRRTRRPGAPSLMTGRRCASPFKGFAIEAKTVRKHGPGLGRLAEMAAMRVVAFLIFRFGLPVGGFDPARYRHQLVENTDFRKFDDGLRMTLDCTPALADRLEALLQEAEQTGHRPLRPAPAGRRPHDLLRALAHPSRPHPFRRRRHGRLRHGRAGAEAGGVNRASSRTSEARSGIVFRTRRRNLSTVIPAKAGIHKHGICGKDASGAPPF